MNDHPSAMSELRAGTWSSHQRLEKRIDFKSRLSSADAYRAHIEQLWGFYATLEPRLAPGVLDGGLVDYDVRHKLPLLTRDLTALGLSAKSMHELPRCLAVPKCDDGAAALGCAYVLEGATLGGRTLLPMVSSRLGLSADHGATFLASYGDAVGEMWRQFGLAVEAHCLDRRRRATAVAAAIATFGALEGWLCGHPA